MGVEPGLDTAEEEGSEEVTPGLGRALEELIRECRAHEFCVGPGHLRVVVGMVFLSGFRRRPGPS
jgi:hypothetical protein